MLFHYAERESELVGDLLVALLVEEALAPLGVEFVRNEQYETSQMFDSAKLGLARLEGKVKRVFFTPVDIPFFLEDTVRLEMTRKEDLVYPICHNRIGHPVLFSGSFIPRILAYSGERGIHCGRAS